VAQQKNLGKKDHSRCKQNFNLFVVNCLNLFKEKIELKRSQLAQLQLVDFNYEFL